MDQSWLKSLMNFFKNYKYSSTAICLILITGVMYNNCGKSGGPGVSSKIEGPGSISGDSLDLSRVISNISAVPSSVEEAIKTVTVTWETDYSYDYYEIIMSYGEEDLILETSIAASSTSHDVVVPLYRIYNGTIHVRGCISSTSVCVESSEGDTITQVESNQLIGSIVNANSSENDFFGYSVSASEDGSIIVIGAVNEDSSTSGVITDLTTVNDATENSGAAYIFKKSNGNWIQEAMLKAHNPGAEDGFGSQVKISNDGTVVVIGAYGEDSSLLGVRDNDRLGADDDNSVNSGAAYVFRFDGEKWEQELYIKPEVNGGDPDGTSADRRVIDGSGRFTNHSEGGSTGGDNFGFSVQISGDGNTVAVGARSDDSGSTSIVSDSSTIPLDSDVEGAGAVYVYRYNSVTLSWGFESYLKPSSLTVDLAEDDNATGTFAFYGDEFGNVIALSEDGNVMAVAAVREDSSSTGVGGNKELEDAEWSGAVYVFSRSGSTWTEEEYLKATNTGANDFFGESVDISADGTLIAVGARGEDSSVTGINSAEVDNNDMSASGAMYLYRKEGLTWKAEAYIKPPNPGKNNNFARLSLADDGRTLIVAATKEQSKEGGVGAEMLDFIDEDGDGNNDDGLRRSGGVYVYRYSGEWQLENFIREPNPEKNNWFGFSVEISGDGESIFPATPYRNKDSVLQSGTVFLY